MANLVRLDNVDHQALRLATRYGAPFGHAVNQVPVVPNEFEEVQREYPILFRKHSDDSLIAIALLGFDRGENLFVDGENWSGRYVPSEFQRGPISLGRASDADEQFSTFVDLEDDRVGESDGEPLFRSHGGDSPALEVARVAAFTVQDGIAVSRLMFALFSELALLQPLNLNVQLPDGLEYQIKDMFTVGADALRDLDGPSLERLHRSGFLAHAIFVRSSLGNFRALIERKIARLGNG